MKKNLQKLIGNKSILILGFGREGQSTYHLLRKYFPLQKLAIADENETVAEKVIQLKDANLICFSGNKFLDSANQYDLIFKTPGIPYKKIKHLVPANKITSQTDFFIQLFSEQIVGVTGTKGKSTTSSLMYHILKQYTENTIFVGNIGIPHFDMIEKIDSQTKIVCELSSHQLEFISKAPAISVLLNLFQEHLDHYESLEKYHLSKLNILKFQNENDNFIYHADDSLILEYLKKINLKKNYFSYSLNHSVEKGCFVNEGKIIFQNGIDKKIFDVIDKCQLRGSHNLLNIMAAINVCQILKISDSVIQEAIISFKGLEHRLEYVGFYNNIHFYNDSIATIPEATIQAVKSLNNVNTLILGGFDRGIDYSILSEFLCKNSIEHLIFLGKAGKRISEEIKNGKCNSEIFFVNSMEEAVNISMKETIQGAVCLLSPAAASYDMFKDFADRGITYKKAIRSIG